MEKTKVGRPAFQENQRRKENLKIRLLDSEVEKLREFHGFTKEVSKSEMVRNILFRKPIAVKVENLQIQSLISSVNGVKQNLNALLKSGHTGELHDEMESIRDLYENLRKELYVLKSQGIFLTDLMEFTEYEKQKEKWSRY